MGEVLLHCSTWWGCCEKTPVLGDDDPRAPALASDDLADCLFRLEGNRSSAMSGGAAVSFTGWVFIIGVPLAVILARFERDAPLDKRWRGGERSPRAHPGKMAGQDR